MSDLHQSATVNALRDLLKAKVGSVPGAVMGVVVGDGSLKDFLDGNILGTLFTSHGESAAGSTTGWSGGSEAVRASATPRQAGLRFKSDLRDNSVVFGVALSGVHEDDITVDVSDYTVKVSAKFFDEGDEDGSVPVIRSFEYELDEDDGEGFLVAGVQATLKRGLLSLIVPIKQAEPVVGERIKIKVG